MDNYDDTQELSMERVNLDFTTHDKIHQQMHRMSFGVDALQDLSLMLSHAIDEDIGVTGEQVNAVLKCVEYSLLTTQRKIIAALDDADKDVH